MKNCKAQNAFDGGSKDESINAARINVERYYTDTRNSQISTPYASRTSTPFFLIKKLHFVHDITKLYSEHSCTSRANAFCQ